MAGFRGIAVTSVPFLMIYFCGLIGMLGGERVKESVG
jgi:hypothetical protein